jgi:hypothetical protein
MSIIERTAKELTTEEKIQLTNLIVKGFIGYLFEKQHITPTQFVEFLRDVYPEFIEDTFVRSTH